MLEPRAFISFDFDNNANEKNLFAGQAKNSKTPFSIKDWSSKESLPQAQWESLINGKIAITNMVIVLVGKSTYLATGVTREIRMARTNDVPYFGVFVDGATRFTPLPEGLASNRIINWEWDTIAAAVKQMMQEGKNK